MFSTSLPSSSGTQQRSLPHILVVDDEANDRQLLKRILQRMAHITEAGDGRTALGLLKAQQFDLVLLDIMMPDMSGFDVLRIIRSAPETADLTVVLISALTDADDLVRGLQEANGYITKPIDIDAVLAHVEAHLNQART